MKSSQIFILSALLLFSFSALASAKAQTKNSFEKTTQTLMLGETAVRINIYEKKGANITFVAPHHNEQTGIKTIREIIEISGGRFVELESFDEKGIPARRVQFKFNGASYSIDPNRIFTENGRACSGLTPEVEPLVKSFAENFLKILLAPEGNRLRDGEKFLVAIHNNTDVDSKIPSEQASDLTIFSFLRPSKMSLTGGAYYEQADGVFLSNLESDEDNFVFLSTPQFASFFIDKGFNVVVQTTFAKFPSKRCIIDDGSMSVFAAQQNIPYINLEADIATGAFRQRQMINSVYRLFFEFQKNEPTANGKD